MFNTMTTFPASWFKIPEFDMLIYEVLCHLKRHDLNLSMIKLASCIFTMWSSYARVDLLFTYAWDWEIQQMAWE